MSSGKEDTTNDDHQLQNYDLESNMPQFAQNELFEDAEMEGEGSEGGEVVEENPDIPNAIEDNEDMDDDMILNTDALIVTGCAEG